MTEPPYKVELTASARRGLATMPEKAASAVIEFCFGALTTSPHRVGKPLVRDLTGYHAARRGDYRIIYRIDETTLVVYVARVQHRSDVYRRQ